MLPLRRRARSGRVSETIARRIKKQISTGALLPGEKLPAERDMAQRFRTSRVSVREAYRSLEELGLLTIRRGAEGGAFIADIDHGPVMRSLSLMLQHVAQIQDRLGRALSRGRRRVKKTAGNGRPARTRRTLR